VVSVQQVLAGGLRPWLAAVYVAGQFLGAVAGAILANVMFGLDAVAFSQHGRSGGALLLSEAVATFGLVAVIMSTSRHSPRTTPFAVAAYIVAAYWFTASTSFANPAVTLGRAFSDTFAGIRLADVPAFIAAQVVAGAVANPLFSWLLREPGKER
jgi:glycerol uptake facilitator-like aquaporin